jgi:hypothetical protein
MQSHTTPTRYQDIEILPGDAILFFPKVADLPNKNKVDGDIKIIARIFRHLRHPLQKQSMRKSYCTNNTLATNQKRM